VPTTTIEDKSPNIRCHAAQHMRPQEYALYAVAMRLTSGGTNPLYFDGRKMADRFRKASKSGIYRTADALADKGWFQPENRESTRDPKSKRFIARRYKVLSHDEWIAEHGDSECIDHSIPVPYSGTEPPTVDAESLRRRIYSALVRLREVATETGCLSESTGLVCTITTDPGDTGIFCASPSLLHRMVGDLAQSLPVPHSPFPSTGTESTPVPKSADSSPKNELIQSQNCEIPVPPAGHSFVFSSVTNFVKDNSVDATVSRKRISSRPTLEEVTQYCQERHNAVDPQKWFDHYSSNGWKVGRNPMKDWQAAVRTWERNGVLALKQSAGKSSRHCGLDKIDYTQGLEGFDVVNGGGQ